MKSQIYGAAALLIAALTLGGCTGLQQFPEVSDNYVGDLKKLDPDYEKALKAINAKTADANEKKRIRNEEIDRRLRVIDLNFSEFRRGLAKEGVAAEFGVAVVEVAVGATGALVAQTASQILSAASGGLAGAHQAYSKAALYDQSLSALLAQMIASRKAVLVKIYESRTLGIDDYPLSAAVKHLEAYEFAGSLPGAVIATAADAKVKNDQAQNQLNQLTEFSFLKDEAGDKLQKFWMPDGKNVNAANATAIRAEMTKLGLDTGPGRLANFVTGGAFAELRVTVVEALGL